MTVLRPVRITVVHLARVDGNDVAGQCLDVPDAAPRAMGTRVKDADAETIMSVPGEGAVGGEGEGLDAGDGGSALLCPM